MNAINDYLEVSLNIRYIYGNYFFTNLSLKNVDEVTVFYSTVRVVTHPEREREREKTLNCS